MPGLAALSDRLGSIPPVRGGRLSSIRGNVAEAQGLDLPLGGLAEIESNGRFLPTEVVGFRDRRVQLMPLGTLRGAAEGCRVWPLAQSPTVSAGDFLLGRVIDALGNPIDGGPPLPIGVRAPLYREPISPLERPVLSEALDVGVRSINALVTLARGQRVGILAGAGVGKSTLLAMMVRGTAADVVVVGLVGERGREVREFIDRELGHVRARTIVVAEPADASPLLRVRGAYTATAVAEHFRDQGKDVLLLVDSLTRFALAGREIGLARGEPATTKGYTPSVFAELPRLLERAGRTERGSITAVYSVLVEGEDLEDPIVDSLRAILDGHVVLSRDLAERSHYPAVDVLASVSRSMVTVTDPDHGALAAKLRRLLAAYRDAEDLIQVGAYTQGSDALVDEAIARRQQIEVLLQQDANEVVPYGDSVAQLAQTFTEMVA
jgi:flagellum-specific ATP synthase